MRGLLILVMLLVSTPALAENNGLMDFEPVTPEKNPFQSEILEYAPQDCPNGVCPIPDDSIAPMTETVVHSDPVVYSACACQNCTCGVQSRSVVRSFESYRFSNIGDRRHLVQDHGYSWAQVNRMTAAEVNAAHNAAHSGVFRFSRTVTRNRVFRRFRPLRVFRLFRRW